MAKHKLPNRSFEHKIPVFIQCGALPFCIPTLLPLTVVHRFGHSFAAKIEEGAARCDYVVHIPNIAKKFDPLRCEPCCWHCVSFFTLASIDVVCSLFRNLTLAGSEEFLEVLCEEDYDKMTANCVVPVLEAIGHRAEILQLASSDEDPFQACIPGRSHEGTTSLLTVPVNIRLEKGARAHVSPVLEAWLPSKVEPSPKPAKKSGPTARRRLAPKGVKKENLPKPMSRKKKRGPTPLQRSDNDGDAEWSPPEFEPQSAPVSKPPTLHRPVPTSSVNPPGGVPKSTKRPRPIAPASPPAPPVSQSVVSTHVRLGGEARLKYRQVLVNMTDSEVQAELEELQAKLNLCRNELELRKP